MVFEVNEAKKEILEYLVIQDWTPTDLAEELDKSTNTVYNHLEELHERGLLTRTQVPAKTRPKTQYSIGEGFLQYVAVLPGRYTQKSVELSPEKQAILHIWDIPQAEFHPFVQKYWWGITNSEDLDYRVDVKAVAVFGSVARGDADADSDVDCLVIAADDSTANDVTDVMGTLRVDANGKSKLFITEAYTLKDYRKSLARGSDFLADIEDELHVIYDPERILRPTTEGDS